MSNNPLPFSLPGMPVPTKLEVARLRVDFNPVELLERAQRYLECDEGKLVPGALVTWKPGMQSMGYATQAPLIGVLLELGPRTAGDPESWLASVMLHGVQDEVIFTHTFPVMRLRVCTLEEAAQLKETYRVEKAQIEMQSIPRLMAIDIDTSDGVPSRAKMQGYELGELIVYRNRHPGIIVGLDRDDDPRIRFVDQDDGKLEGGGVNWSSISKMTTEQVIHFGGTGRTTHPAMTAGDDLPKAAAVDTARTFN